MGDFGAELKLARESRGISLRQIATATKISVSALEALERNDFSRLPGGIFSRAFVRAYAVEVGLDPEQTVETFLVEYGRAHVPADNAPRPEVTADDRAFLERQRRAASFLRAGLIVLVLLVAGGIIVWQYGAGFGSRASPESPPKTESPPPATTPPAISPAAPPPAPAPAAAPATDQIAVHVDISELCWVRVTADGVVAFEQTLQAGDQRDFKAVRELYLQVGNASSVRWTINGKPAKDLGRPGQPGTARLTPVTLGRYLQ